MASHQTANSSGGYRSQNQSPIAPRAPQSTGSAMASPAGSVLLPPVEIEVSPAQSSRSTYSASSSSHRRAHRDDNDSEGDDTRFDEKQYQQQQQQLQHQTYTLSSRKQTDASRTGRVHPDGGSGRDPYESEMLGLPKRRESELRRSSSSLSLQVRRHGWFGRLRRSPNFILFTVFLALFVDMATVRLSLLRYL
jgi:hypothetical protein